MTAYLYVLGRTPELAFQELKTFLPDVTQVSPEIAKSTKKIAIKLLGGTVKIAQVVSSIDIQPRSTFGISVYEGKRIPRNRLEELKKSSNAARFVEPRDGNVLSSVVVKKNHVQEFIVVDDIIAKTVEVQPFEEWNRRDYKRPYADPKAGMLPPKVARMIVNCAGLGEGKTLLDPFCGMGTILAEAAYMGWSVRGSDQSKDVVEKAQKNLQWANYTNISVTVSDATHISEIVGKESLDAIVTEPFMGNPDVSGNNVRNVVKGLEKLYIGCLKEWYPLLVSGGKVVIAFPTFTFGLKRFVVKKVIDMCENLGYTTQTGPIEYGRDQAKVKRSFYIFQKRT